MLTAISVSGHPLDTWHLRQPKGKTGDLLSVCYGNGLFVAVGLNGAILTSDTGESWVRRQSGTSALLTGVGFGHGSFVAVGANGTILSSSDGSEWIRRDAGVRSNLGSIEFGNGRFVAAGWHVFLTSENGVSWSPQTNALVYSAPSLTYGNGLFVLEGTAGTNVVSVDGIRWTERPSGTSAGLYAIGFGNDVFMAIDHGKRVFVSSDASKWVEQGMVTGVRTESLAYGDGYFVTGGPEGIEYSSSGTVWSQAPTSILSRDICFGSRTFVAVGYLEGIVQSAPVTSVSCIEPPSGVVAWWPGENNTWDIISGADGSFGPQTFPTYLTYSNGLVGTAFRFTSGFFLTVPATPELDVGLGDGFTFETWLNPQTTIGGGILGWGGAYAGQPYTPFGVRLLLSSQGYLSATLVKTNNQAFLLQSGAGVIATNVWQHLALSCDTLHGDMLLYVNGEVVAQTNIKPGALRTSGVFTLGALGIPFGLRLNGLMDEPALYNRALTQDEILAIYEAGESGKCEPASDCGIAEADIAGWWRGESNALDSVGMNHGAMYPSNFPVQVGYTTGAIGSAFSFRYGDYVVIPTSPDLDAGFGPGLTVEGWVNLYSTAYPLVEWNDGAGNQGVNFGYSVTRGPAYLEANLVDVQGQSHVLSSPYLPPAYQQWRHVALSYDKSSGSAALLVDGSVVTRANLGSFTPNTRGNLYLGYRPPGSYPGSGSKFNGLMDEVTVYRRALTTTELRCVYRSGLDAKYPPMTECVPPADGIVSWWRGESNLLDSVADNHGQPRAAVTYTNGRVGNAIVTGKPGYVIVGKFNSTIVPAGTGLTLEGWIQPDQFQSGTICGWGGSGVHLDCNVQGSILHADLRDTNGFSHLLTAPRGFLQPGIWQHVALTYDGASGQGTLFLNGAPVASTNLGRFAPRTFGNFWLGYGPGGYFRGALDECAIYQRALTSFEIAAIYRSLNGRCTDPPTMVRQPESMRVNVGSDVAFSVEAMGNPLLRYQWFMNGKPMNGANWWQTYTNAVLALTNVSEYHQAAYSVIVTNAFGLATSSNAFLQVNYPPVADASATELPVISPNNTNAVVILDGSRTSDPDHDPLDYQWLSVLNSQPSTLLATGAVAVVTLPVGMHPVQLVVNDGLLTSTNAVTVEVITPAEAVQRLMASVEDSSLRPLLKHRLRIHLRLAAAFFAHNHFVPGVVQLEVLKRQVHRWVEPRNPALATQWTASAQAIINAVKSGWSCGSALEQLLGMVRSSDLPDGLRTGLEKWLLSAIVAANQGATQSETDALKRFMAEVEAGLGNVHPELAGMLTDTAREIVEQSSSTSRRHIRPEVNPAPGRMRMHFSAEPGQRYIIEASSDLLHWEKIGVATETGDGNFEFEDAESDQLPCRYYRVVMP